MDAIDARVKKGGLNALGRLVSAVLQTEECGDMIRAVAPGVLSAWAGESAIRKAAAGLAGRIAAGGFARGAKPAGETVIPLLEDPEFIRGAMDGMPALIMALTGALEAFIRGLGKLPPEEKARVLGAFIERTRIGGHLGRDMTALARIVSDIHGQYPTFFTDRLLPGIREWIEDTDFGEIKECVDSSTEDIVSFIRALSEELWRYPAKVVCVLALAPSLLNTIVDSLREVMAPLSKLAPDLLADVVLSLLREIDGTRIGKLINEGAELAKKINTGSALLGEQGSPQIPRDIAGLAADVLKAVDLDLLFKVRAMTAETAEAAGVLFMDLVGERPELARELVADRFREAARAARRLDRTIDMLERVFSGGDAAGGIARGLEEVDPQEISRLLSRIFSMLNRIHESSPALVREFLSQVLGSLDEHEAGETAGWLMEDLVSALKPIAPRVLPPVVRGMAELLSCEGGEGDELRDALSALRAAITGKEGP